MSDFNGNFVQQCMEDSISPKFLQFVCMIEIIPDIKSQLRFRGSKIDLTMVQLLQYNCYSRCINKKRPLSCVNRNIHICKDQNKTFNGNAS